MFVSLAEKNFPKNLKSFLLEKKVGEKYFIAAFSSLKVYLDT